MSAGAHPLLAAVAPGRARIHPLVLALGTLGDDATPTLPAVPAVPALPALPSAPNLPTPLSLVPPAPSNLSTLLTTAQTASGAPAISQADVQNAIAGYTGLSVQSQQALLSAAQGVASGGLNVNTLTPLLAAGFASVGLAPLAAVLVVGLPLVETVGSLLSPTPKCDWNVGAFCVTQPLGPPYGPNDVARWQTFAEWYAVALLLAASSGGSLENYIQGLESIGLAGDWPTPTTPQDVFLQVYQAAWRLNAEFLINGHTWLDPYQLLLTIQALWNATHGSESTYGFANTDDNYIGYLLKGVYGEAQYYAPGDHPSPLTINTGPAVAVAAPSSAGSSSSSSSAGTAVAVAAGAAVLGVGLWAGVTGRLAQWLAF